MKRGDPGPNSASDTTAGRWLECATTGVKQLALKGSSSVSGRQTYAPEARHHQYRFGEFTLDLDSGFLRRGADEITLRPKVFDALTYLVERSGRLVTKAELIGAIWPDAAVTDNSLAQCLLEIRRALGDDSQQMIRTVARRGYMFAAPVTTPALEFPRSPGEAPESARGPARISEADSFQTRTLERRGRRCRRARGRCRRDPSGAIREAVQKRDQLHAADRLHGFRRRSRGVAGWPHAGLHPRGLVVPFVRSGLRQDASRTARRGS